MRSREVLIVLVVVAVIVTLFDPSPEQGVEPATTPTPLQTAAQESKLSKWTVNGIALSDSVEDISRLEGVPTSDKTDSDIRFTAWQTGEGRISRTEFHRDETLGIMGTVLRRNGETVVRAGTTVSEMKEQLGEPESIQRENDHTAYQYNGARVYIRDGVAFGVVIEGSLPSPRP